MAEAQKRNKLMKSTKAVAVVTILIILVIIGILATGVFIVLTNQSRLVERRVRRIQAYYTAQAGMWQAFFDLYEDGVLDNSNLLESINNIPAANVEINSQAVSGTGTRLDGTKKITIAVEY